MPAVMRGGADTQSPGEDAGEGEDVVDLVRVVAAAGCDDGRVRARDLGVDLGRGVGHGEDEGTLGHGGDRVLGNRSAGDTDEDVRACQRLLHVAGEAGSVGAQG
jgi:hypothetical protein